MPFVLAVAVFYYFSVTSDYVVEESHGYAPGLVSYALSSMYPFAYATAAAFGAWESGRLVKASIWELGPVRSRYRVALESLLPVVVLSILAVVLPVVLSLVQGAAYPTPASLRPLLLAVVLCVAHAVLGFAVGRWVRPELASPILGVVVFLAVAYPVALDTFWLRHVTGQYPHALSYGEAATWSSIAAHALPMCALAGAVALLWLPIGRLAQRGLVGVLTVSVAVVAAWSTVRDWGPTPPVETRVADLECVGSRPEVCTPKVPGQSSEAVSADVREVLQRLRTAGVEASPNTVTDTLVDGRYPRESTHSVWRLALTEGRRDGLMRYQLVRQAVAFPCAKPDVHSSRMVVGWAAAAAGEQRTFGDLLGRDPFFDASEQRALEEELSSVRKKSSEEQRDWYRTTRDAACSDRERDS
ncbi:hypothetical protein MTQ01_06970 [Streptomyces sp. XM4193]|uniref:DUF7224 domain-containing protein n=1 Tax=Streptomyces sp. XM4193 TaxID=2929782 RepID=UPI001FF7B9D2|nr:hypothetical protein [Streptomyces sp. XM4193]MCK1795755.1 hypothetical protein [Streptomyces sp. XM4193]